MAGLVKDSFSNPGVWMPPGKIVWIFTVEGVYRRTSCVRVSERERRAVFGGE